MKIRCDSCNHIITVPKSAIHHYASSQGGRSRSPAKLKAGTQNLVKARAAQAVLRELAAGLDKHDSAPVRHKRGHSAKQKLSVHRNRSTPRALPLKAPATLINESLSTIPVRPPLIGPWREHGIREVEGQLLCKQVDLTTYHWGVGQLIWHNARKHCRARTDKMVAQYLDVIVMHLSGPQWPSGWTCRSGRVDLPSKSVLPRHPWISDRGIWIEGRPLDSHGKRGEHMSILVYCCEWL